MRLVITYYRQNFHSYRQNVMRLVITCYRQNFIFLILFFIVIYRQNVMRLVITYYRQNRSVC